MMKNKIIISERIYNFFENPYGWKAYLVQVFIFILIFVSVGIVVLEFFYRETYAKYEFFLHNLNFLILGIFTFEYLIRLFTAPIKWQFIKKPFNIIDFLAVAPNYIELLLPFFIETTELRVLRVIRLLRFARALRVLKVFKYAVLFKKIFQFHETILETIFSILVIFAGIKGVIWVLETFHLWIVNTDLGELFAIIGFALGIILSQKIGVSYDKFLGIEEAIIRIYGRLRSLSLILDGKIDSQGSKVTSEWAKEFIKLISDPKADDFIIHQYNAKLYSFISKIEKQPGEVTMLCGEIAQDAAYCLSKKVRITPKAYDTLLHQATMLYLLLITVFIPGIAGMISIILATYILYGMYQLTQDLDSILGGEHNLININMSELSYLANEDNQRVIDITKIKKGNK